jgi:crotonobetainyl-CoA:carnitine CoA-transferase CaiB-like acyl-CoA transferase
MERPDLREDARYTTAAARANHGEAINAEVARWVSQLTADEVHERCTASGVPVAPILDVAGIFADPQIASRGDLTVVDDPVVGPIRQQAAFPRLGNQPRPAPAGAPRLGEHTRAVLSELCGLEEVDFDRLAKDGTI